MDWLNPQNFIKNYEELFNLIYYGILDGFWPRFLGVAFLILAFWMYFRRRNMPAGILCFLAAAASVYGSTLLMLFRRVING